MMAKLQGVLRAQSVVGWECQGHTWCNMSMGAAEVVAELALS